MADDAREERLLRSLADWVDGNRGDLITVAPAVDGHDAERVAEALLAGLLGLGSTST